MRTVSYRLADLAKAVVSIGHVAENEATQVRIDAGEVFAEYPNAVAGISVISPAGDAYPVTVTRDGDTVVWDVQDSALTADGMGEFQVTFTAGETVVKSCVGRTNVKRSIVGDGEAPDPIQDWMTEADAALEEIEGISATAETLSAGSQATASYADGVLSFGIPQGAQGAPGQDGQDGSDGQDGVSPTVAVTEITGGHTVTITDAEGDHAFNVMDGTAGAVIDDTAGAGDTDKTWSADKLTSDVLSAIQQVEEGIKEINDLDNDLLDDVEWKEGTVNPDTGADEWSNTRLLSGYIPVDRYDELVLTVDADYKYMVALINGAKTAIVNTLAWYMTKTTIDLSNFSTAKYMRLVLQKTDNTRPSSAEYIHAVYTTELIERIDGKVTKGEVSYDTLADDMKGIFTYKYNESPETLNFVNENCLLLTTGNLLSYTGNYAVTDYMDCSGWRSMKYSGRWYYDGQCLAFYDESKNFISAFPGTNSNWHDYVLEVITIPNNAKYIRVAKCNKDTSIYIAVDIVPAKAGFKWVGKKWVCIGDSLTEVNATAAKRYHDYVADNTGITVVNLGVSGTGYMNGGSGDSNPFRNRVSSIPLDADVITIFGSFNDLGNTLGTKTDTGTSTIGGCINTTLDEIFARLPLANIGIVTPTPWGSAYPLDGETPGQAYVELLKEICYARGIPVLDLNHCSQLRPWDADFITAAYSNDNTGVHPDENGHKLIAPRFEGFLDTLLLV